MLAGCGNGSKSIGGKAHDSTLGMSMVNNLDTKLQVFFLNMHSSFSGTPLMDLFCTALNAIGGNSSPLSRWNLIGIKKLEYI